MISFENTEVAFRRMTRKDLNRAYLLFKTISSNSVVALGNFGIKMALSLHLPMNWIIKPTVYSHFVGGETIDECKPVVKTLSNYKVGGILDYSVEGAESAEGIQAALEETLRTIRNAASDPNVPFSVFKPTAFTTEHVLEKASTTEPLNPDEQAELDRFWQRVETLCSTAYENKVRIMIDAEDYKYQKAIDDVCNAMMAKYNKEQAIVFNTFQMYRWDRLDYLKESHRMATEGGYWLGAKFVRGAYMERERRRAAEMNYKDPIQPNKEATDRDYNAALKYCINNLDNISIFNGTHNEYSSRYMAELMVEKGIDKKDDRCWFSQLYGMSDHISFNLADAGYNVAKYLPYGPVRHVLPYLFRRVEENTSVAGQTSRELNLLTLEMNRRKAKR